MKFWTTRRKTRKCNGEMTSRLAFHFQNGMLRYIFAIGFCFLLCSLLEGLISWEDHYSFALEASKQTHLPSLGWCRHVRLIQDVVSFFAGSNFNKLAQEQRSTLRDGRELRCVFVLPLHAVNLQVKKVRLDKKIRFRHRR